MSWPVRLVLGSHQQRAGVGVDARGVKQHHVVWLRRLARRVEHEQVDLVAILHPLQIGDELRLWQVVAGLFGKQPFPFRDAQTRRFNSEASSLTEVGIYNISMDLPFAQTRWCDATGVSNVTMLSDHRDASFGRAYGTLVKELRLESRALFVVGTDDKVLHVEYVGEIANHPDYDAALKAIKDSLG